MGTALGNRTYAQGDWIKSGSDSVGFVHTGLTVWLPRGPRHKSWIGCEGGNCMFKDVQSVRNVGADVGQEFDDAGK